MKKKLLSIGLVFAAFCAYSQQATEGYEGLIVEKYYISTEADSIASANAGVGALPVGSVTYRIYVDLAPGYFFTGVKASETHPLKIKTTTSFYNNENRGINIADKQKFAYLKENTTMLDSWISMGSACSGYFGVLKSEDTTTAIVNADGILKNDVAEMGIPLTQRDGMMKVANVSPNGLVMAGDAALLDIFDAQNKEKKDGDSLVTNLFAYGALGGATGPTATNKVLLGQFTTNGVFSYELNINIGRKGSTKFNHSLVAKNASEDTTRQEYVFPELTASFAPVKITPLTAVVKPLTGKYVAGDVIALEATTTGNNISSVEFFVDGVSVGAPDTQAPYVGAYTATAGTHAVTAKVTNANGSVTSSAVQITIDPKVGLDNALEANTFKVYPNPVIENQFTIETSTLSDDAVYTIYSNNGAVIAQKALVSNKESISIDNLKAGEYIVELQNNGTKKSTIVIKK